MCFCTNTLKTQWLSKCILPYRASGQQNNMSKTNQSTAVNINITVPIRHLEVLQESCMALKPLGSTALAASLRQRVLSLWPALGWFSCLPLSLSLAGLQLPGVLTPPTASLPYPMAGEVQALPKTASTGLFYCPWTKYFLLFNGLNLFGYYFPLSVSFLGKQGFVLFFFFAQIFTVNLSKINQQNQSLLTRLPRISGQTNVHLFFIITRHAWPLAQFRVEFLVTS